MEESPFYVYREGKPPALQMKAVGLKKRKLPSWMVSFGKKEKKQRRAIKAARKTGYTKLKLEKWMKNRKQQYVKGRIQQKLKR